MTGRGGLGSEGSIRASDNLGKSSSVSKSVITASSLWSLRISLKRLRKVFGFGPSSKSDCARLIHGWAFSRLEKHMLVPTSLSRTYLLSNEWHDKWHDYEHVTRKDSSGGNQRTPQETLATPTTRQQPLSQPTLRPQTPVSTPAIEESLNNENFIAPSPPFTPDEEERRARFDKQFGPIGSQTHRYVNQHIGGELPELVVDEPAYYYLLTTHISYLILIAFGRVRDFFGKRFRSNQYRHIKAADGYAALNSDFDNFYFRRLKMRMNDCFSRPITGVPGRYITLMDRETRDQNKHFTFTGTYTETLNLSSYNYLGFAQSEGPCADAVQECIEELGTSSGSPRADSGTSDLVVEVEREIAKFVRKPDAVVFSMGFSTNATSFPALVSKGCLVISDELNHASIRIGARLSGATIRSYKHNDMHDLERLLREAISYGQPNTSRHRPWKKILVVAEGLFSMEGTITDLPGLLRLKKKYKYYLFIDEAHSIGALGPRGRGVCDYFNVDPTEVDILMGTLTKSFGANGGYVAADKHIIDKLRATNAAMIYGESPAPPVLMQILSSLRIITGEVAPGQGEERLQRIAFNSRYLRLGLKRLGFIVYGHDDCPWFPSSSTIPENSRLFLGRCSPGKFPSL
jgi:serine palmitoyltransferase